LFPFVNLGGRCRQFIRNESIAFIHSSVTAHPAKRALCCDDALGNLQYIGLTREQLQHERIVRVRGLLEAIELLFTGLLLLNLVTARAHKLPE